MAEKKRRRPRQVTVTMADELRDEFQVYLDVHHIGFSEWVRGKMREALEAERERDEREG